MQHIACDKNGYSLTLMAMYISVNNEGFFYYIIIICYNLKVETLEYSLQSEPQCFHIVNTCRGRALKTGPSL